jgi:4-hydroxy-3-methylbut-2-enyl diphosphate reductase
MSPVNEKMTIEIDPGSGFCFGVTRAIGKAEEELQQGRPLYCLGDIVHNGREVERLGRLGLVTIDHEAFSQLHDANVLLRAHGEPPATYRQAIANNIHLIDATCPVVLHLQERIKREYDADPEHRKQIVIFGKPGHAEVLGLVGQTDGTAIVIERPEDVTRLDFTRDICLYSQTTKSLEGFRQIVEYIQAHIAPTATFTYSDTICRQVANRMPHIREFAARHDIVLFVCGHKSSNGRVLYNECRSVNPHSYMIDSPEEIVKVAELHQAIEHRQDLSIGICGATSTPKWLMEQCKVRVEELQV